MRRNQVEVRGCCMGIPFGCGSVLLLIASLGFWQATGSPWFLFGAAAPALGAAVISISYYARLYFERRGAKLTSTVGSAKDSRQFSAAVIKITGI